jgi:hypothetical protein
MPNEIQTQLISRGIIFGIATGIPLGVVEYLFAGGPGPLLLLIFLIPSAIIAYKFVGDALSGIFYGLATVVTEEIFVALIYGGMPFYALFHINYFIYSQVILSYVISFIGFPLVGYLAGRYSRKRGVVKLPYYGSHELTELEGRVLSYIKANNNRIHIVECALALNVEPALVEKAVKSLQQKGEIQT